MTRARGINLIGITGGIGSGKSSVARYLSSLPSLAYIDADEVCRSLLEPRQPGWQALCAVFGERYLMRPNGPVDRRRLRGALFKNGNLRQEVNQLIHPLAREAIRSRVAKDEENRLFLIEVPLLYESGWQADFGRIIVVYASDKVRLTRLMKRDGATREEGLAALASQQPLAQKALRADHVIDNGGSWAYTCLQLIRLQAILQQLAISEQRLA